MGVAVPRQIEISADFLIMIVKISRLINHSDSRLTFQSIATRLESWARCGSQKGASAHTRNAEQPRLLYLALSVCSSSGRPASCNDNGNGTACVKTGLKVHLCDRLTPPGGGGRIRAAERHQVPLYSGSQRREQDRHCVIIWAVSRCATVKYKLRMGYTKTEFSPNNCSFEDNQSHRVVFNETTM